MHRRGMHAGEKGWGRGFGPRKQKSRFQLRAPRAAAAAVSSRLPDFPPRPAPPLPGAGSGVHGGLILERGREHGGEREAVAVGGGEAGRRGPSSPLPEVSTEPPRSRG